jgi:hypothetical protein
VPEQTARPLVVGNTAREDTEFKQGGAQFATRTDRVGLRRVEAGGVKRLYAAYRLDVHGEQIERGWYFLRLAIVKSRKIGAQTAAWLRVQSNGRPAFAVYQTHAEFADADWPALGEFPALKNYKQAHNEAPRVSRERMQRLQLPDLYTPGWPGRTAR